MPLAYRSIDRGMQYTIEQLLTGNFEIRAPFNEDRLTYPHLFERILVTPLGYLQVGHRGVQLSAGNELPFPEPDGTVVILPRLIEHGACLAYQGRAFGIHPIIGAFWRQAETRPGLL
jgi:hypothetical protein